jgi:hypothetical protein
VAPNGSRATSAISPLSGDKRLPLSDAPDVLDNEADVEKMKQFVTSFMRHMFESNFN